MSSSLQVNTLLSLPRLRSNPVGLIFNRGAKGLRVQQSTAK